MTRFALLLIFALLSRVAPAQKPFVDPTGTYTLKGDIARHRIIGHSGEIRVKLLGSRQVALSFYINKGYPDYSAGSFTDTVSYAENMARWTPPDHPEYTLIISFSAKEAETMQLFDGEEPRSSFGEDVMVSAVFEKSSSDVPVIKDLSAHGVVRS
jgi:hypothetical protein